MRNLLIKLFKIRMKKLNWRQCFNMLLKADATYEEQRKCETLYDEYHERKRNNK